MSFPRVSKGQPFDPPSMREGWNAAMDVANAYARGELGPRTSPESIPGERLVIRNETGFDCPRFGILGISGSIILPEDNEKAFLNRIALTGAVPNPSSHSGKFAVTLEPIADGKIGSCRVIGVVQAIVDDGDGDFADVAGGEMGYLARGESGARILYVSDEEVTTDRFWAVIAIGAGGGGDCECQEVHELRIDGAPTGGTLPVTYTIGGVPGSAAAITYNSTASSAQTLLEASHASLVGNITVFDGPLPIGAMYILFHTALANVQIPLPTVTNSLTGGTNPIPKIGRLTTPGF